MAAGSYKFDEIDLKIVRMLQEDGRITNLELSNKIGLSPGPTLERVKKLEKQKVIEGYHARINKKRAGLGVSVMIQVSLSRQIENVISRFKQKIMTIPEVVECYQITGNADYLLKVVVADITAFEKIIADRFSKFDEIGQMHTMLIISEVKNNPVMPLG
jgi:Lrp/AsnC family leucine-responsive transcriptional regulator